MTEPTEPTTIVALYVGRSDEHGAPLRRSVQRLLTGAVTDALASHSAVVLSSGRLTGADEHGTPELSDHYLCAVPSGSVAPLLLTVALYVASSSQRSFGAVGVSPLRTVWSAHRAQLRDELYGAGVVSPSVAWEVGR